MLNIKIGKMPIAYFSILPICILIMNTSSFVLKYSRLFYYIICAVFLLGISKHVLRYKEERMWIFCVALLWLTSFWSIDLGSTIAFCISLTMYSLLIMQRRDIGFYESLIKWLNRFIIFGLVTIYLNILIPDLFTVKLSFLMSEAAEKTTIAAVAQKKYSGIFYDIANAAFALNIGFAIAYCKYLNSAKKGKRINLILMAAFMGAIIVTGKRTLCVIPVVLIMISGFLTVDNERKKRIYGLITIVLIAILILAPTFSSYFIRDNVSGDFFNSRTTVIWPIALDAFRQHSLTGTGFNTFNMFMQKHYAGFASDTLANWNYHAHDIYIQFLAETGVIITGVLVLTFIMLLRATILALKNSGNNVRTVTMLRLSCFIQIIWLLYGITGNTFYYKGQLLAYIVAIGMLGVCKYEQEKNRNTNVSQSR